MNKEPRYLHFRGVGYTESLADWRAKWFAPKDEPSPPPPSERGQD